MTISINLLDAYRASRPARALGVALGTRAAGLAVTTAEHVVHHQVLNLGKLTTQTGKEARFRQVLQDLLERHEPSMLALVSPAGQSVKRGLLCSLDLWLREEAGQRALPLHETTSDEVRRALVPPGEQPSGRRLAEALCKRFEGVRVLAPSRESVPGAEYVPELALRGRRTRSSRELYWRPMFQALGSAVLALQHGTHPPYESTPHQEESPPLGPGP